VITTLLTFKLGLKTGHKESPRKPGGTQNEWDTTPSGS
jgi:hypothetical protein